jgi:AcrR family transcriptional regulator
MSQPAPHPVKRDAEGTRRRILAAATDQFTTHGLAGARIDAIARAANTNERMLYYYFGAKKACTSRCSRECTSTTRIVRKGST